MKTKSSPAEKTALQLKPPLKWAGGKRWLLPELTQHIKAIKFNRLVEPFCGGLAVSLGLQPKQALLNDVNPHLINFYTQLQNGLITEAMAQWPFKNQRQYFLDARQQFNRLIDQNNALTPEGAALFYYLNRTGFNGLCRFNQSGLFNVPFGQYKTITYKKDFLDYQPLLKNWQFSLGDFKNLPIKSSDLIYADPPYDVEFVQYAQQGFNWDDQQRLATWLAKQSCPIITSNQATERIVALYTALDFKVEIIKAPRRIACNGNRTPAEEMLGFKNL